MYANLQEPDSALAKISRSLYLIVSISLLTHTTSITYSVMSFKELSAGFISIIVSSVVCFFLSASHLTIYGISVLGILYVMILQPYYTRPELHYMVAISGLIIFPFWKIIHSVGSIFNCLPGRIHASMVFGVALIILTKFFPLAIQNMEAFFVASKENPLTSPIDIIILTFQQFNYITLGLTILSIFAMFFFRERLQRFPLIAFLVILGILINWTHYFLSYQDLCAYTNVDCKFYILKVQNLVTPTLKQILNVLPAACVMTAIIIFQQFLYLQEFERRGKRFGGEGNLGQVRKQSRVLALANTLSGCFGGLPICINLFGTYQNFAFNQKFGFNGTKLVGLLQLPVSYLLYSILKPLFDMIPLFILFTVVATPTIYFLRNTLKVHKRHILMITFIAILNVVTHPVIALIFASLVSIYDIAELLKAAPAQILMENVEIEGERKTQTLAQVVEKEKTQQLFSEFRSRIKQIDDDQPGSLEGTSYIMYRFTGSVSYLNYFSHIDQINSLIQTHIKPYKTSLVISFRFAQIIDEQSLIELAQYVQRIRDSHIHVIFTGLHTKLIQKMQKIQYFEEMLKQDERCMYCIHPN